MRRLFSNFAHGPPGVGLLLMRVVAGFALVAQAVPQLLVAPLGPTVLQAVSIGLGMLLVVGLWTPLVGTLVAIDSLWDVLVSGHPWRWSMLATLGAALALIGPGAWSIDARLFGWRRVEIGPPKNPAPPTSHDPHC